MEEPSPIAEGVATSTHSDAFEGVFCSSLLLSAAKEGEGRFKSKVGTVLLATAASLPA